MNFGFMRPGHGAMHAATIRPHHLAAVRGAATSTPRHRPMPAVSGLNRAPRVTGSLSRQPPTLMDSASEALDAILGWVTSDAGMTSFAAGAIGAAVSRTATAPLDLVKTLQQAATPQAKGQGGNVLADMLLKLAKVYEKGGLQAFFKGNGVNCAKSMTERGTMHGLMDVLLAACSGAVSLPGNKVAAQSLATMAAQLLVFPIDTVRTRLMLSDPGVGLFDVACKLVVEEGAATLFRGVGPQLAMTLPCTAIDVRMKDLMVELGCTGATAKGVGGMLASGICTILTHPITTVRTQMLKAGAGAALSPIATARHIVARGGVPALYAGLLPSMGKILPAALIANFVTEALKLQLRGAARRLAEKEGRAKEAAACLPPPAPTPAPVIRAARFVAPHSYHKPSDAVAPSVSRPRLVSLPSSTTPSCPTTAELSCAPMAAAPPAVCESGAMSAPSSGGGAMPAVSSSCLAEPKAVSTSGGGAVSRGASSAGASVDTSTTFGPGSSRCSSGAGARSSVSSVSGFGSRGRVRASVGRRTVSCRSSSSGQGGC